MFTNLKRLAGWLTWWVDFDMMVDYIKKCTMEQSSDRCRAGHMHIGPLDSRRPVSRTELKRNNILQLQESCSLSTTTTIGLSLIR